MAERKPPDPDQFRRDNEEIPPGATQKASDRTARPGGPPASPLDDPYAAGTPGGGTEIGGLAGTNEGHGDPDGEEEELHEAMAHDLDIEAEGEAPYSGRSGGAVGGTPAEGRAKGGKKQDRFSPGSGGHRGDSTIGTDPRSKSE